jgi:thiamine-phosphate pyrophosphorylase
VFGHGYGAAMTLAKWAARLNLRCRRRPAALPPLILVTDRRRLADPLAAAARLPRGSAVLLRHYCDPDRARLAAALARLCRKRGLVLLVGADARLAARIGAGGLHLPEALVARRRWRRRPGWLVTAAAHGEAAVRRAARAGVDACLLSPVFATASHPGARALGPVRFARLAHRAAVPVYALGGIDMRSARRLATGGACGIAAVGAFAARFPAPTGGAIRAVP